MEPPDRMTAVLPAPSVVAMGELDRRRGDERLEERLDLEAFPRRQPEEVNRRGLALAAVHGDGLIEGLGAAVVEIGARVAEAPQRRRPPFAAGGALRGPGRDGRVRLAARLG